ncbi:hypothetical protein SO802_028485 [Lithocarpus litseifolius]|uniref:DDE Tnp4 domain-containing protein n=1 Tax=Lithocarpus litseifolius TaxID=425828 RepID=A0AAW2BQF0_9ROSI
MGWGPIVKTVVKSDDAWTSAIAATPNSSKERELDATFLSSGIHVNVDADSVDDVEEELPTPGEGQSQRCDSVMVDSDSNHDDSDVELEIATTYIQLCIEYVQKYYMKHPMCTNILSVKSYVKEKCVGVIDGTHINASASFNRITAFRDRRSDITQNVMCVCNFNMQFMYVHAGWEGTANDSRVMHDAIEYAEYEFP